PQPPPPPKPPTIKKKNDRITPERKAAIKALTKLTSQSSIGISYNKLTDLLAEAKTEVTIYENAAKDYSKEDDLLTICMNTTVLSYELTLVEWKMSIDARRINDSLIMQRLGESSDLAKKAIEFYNDNWI
ncbi:hypothetical protein, partial [Geobacter sp.]|uniref:hypothetical protein n=1 Tax=Geobacter sp. TaxID=46610 RepID=UPI0026235FF3